MIYNLEAEKLPPGVTPLEAVAVVKVLNEAGEVELWTRSTESLNSWEQLGMLEIAAYSTKRSLHDDRFRPEGGEPEDEDE